MPNPNGTAENLTKFQPQWRQGKTQTIRVPIALVDQVLALARKLDGGESLDTSEKTTELYERVGKLTRQCEQLQAECAKAVASLDTAEDTIADLKNEVANLKSVQATFSHDTSEIDTIKASQLSNQAAPQDSEILELPDAATLLNQLKSRRKKSKTDLQDVEAILELLPEMPAQQSQTQAQLPDLYAARDKLFEMPSLGGWKLEKGEKRTRFWAFAEALIEEVSKLNPDYSIIQRLQSDLKQEREYSQGIAHGMSEEFRKRVQLEKKVGLRR
ncbi:MULTISPECIES: hypothetical protein [Kamptonema]|uniref:hypothetical protein n=1 Tax=Kamptonema TaxID=1501433 RepID=UPI0001DAD3C0|nr:MULTISPECIES: hypothetical protein [Kamptonema]CBN58295.1 hypothetical protein OSCI_3720014 [Kamptonema sp. PCC 6506]